MKTKKFGKKLSLNKMTIVHLHDSKLKEIHGGEAPGLSDIICLPTSPVKSCVTCGGGTTCIMPSCETGCC